MVTTIPEAVTTIPAGTLRLLLASISYRAKARKEVRRQLSMVSRRRVEGTSRCALTVDPVSDRKPPSAALASDPQTVGADPAGLAWSAICCTIWHESITGTHHYIPYYNRRLC
nr:MAG TPA: hypothetical protein [Caudoviricetes sp.]